MPNTAAAAPVRVPAVLGCIAVLVAGGISLMIVLCCGFLWMDFQSGEERRVSGMKDLFAAADAKLAATEVQLTGALARGDQAAALELYGTLAIQAESAAHFSTGVANFLPPGMERDDYFRIAQERRVRGAAYKKNADQLRKLQP